MNQILRCDWLPERARWSYLARSRLPAVSRKKNFPESLIVNPLLTKLVRSRWLDIRMASFFFCEFMDLGNRVFYRVYGPRSFFCEFMDLNSVSVHKRAKKELDQYPAILTSRLVNNPYLFTCQILHACQKSRLSGPSLYGLKLKYKERFNSSFALWHATKM